MKLTYPVLCLLGLATPAFAQEVPVTQRIFGNNDHTAELLDRIHKITTPSLAVYY